MLEGLVKERKGRRKAIVCVEPKEKDLMTEFDFNAFEKNYLQSSSKYSSTDPSAMARTLLSQEMSKPPKYSWNLPLDERIDRDVNEHFMGFGGVNVDSLGEIFSSKPEKERQELINEYNQSHKEPILETLGERLGTASGDYHYLKGLMLKKDTVGSDSAVKAHELLNGIQSSTHRMDVNFEGIRDRTASSAMVSGLLSLKNKFEQLDRNDSLVALVGKLSQEEIAEMKSEHLRIYRRELGEMVENTIGVKAATIKALKNAGID